MPYALMCCYPAGTIQTEPVYLPFPLRVPYSSSSPQFQVSNMIHRLPNYYCIYHIPYELSTPAQPNCVIRYDGESFHAAKNVLAFPIKIA